MNISDAINQRIRYFMRKNNLNSLWDLYKTTGVPKATINALLSSRKTSVPKITTLIQICSGLNTNLKDFF